MSIPDENFISLGCRLAEERKRLLFSQAALASACAISREMVGKYENGRAVPGGEVLFLLAKAGADVSYILTGARTHGYAQGTSQAHAVNERPSTPLARKKAKLMTMIEQITDESAVDRVQEDLEKIERIRRLEQEVADLKKKAG